MAKSLVEALVLQVQSGSRYGLKKWPEGAQRCEQDCSYGVTFYDEEDDELDEAGIDNLPKFDEWDGGETVTKEEFDAFMLAHPTLREDYGLRAEASKVKRAELNEQIGSLIDELTTLCQEGNVDVSINLGQHGSLDPDSDWNDSRC